jgi:hypothetical protein
MIEQLFVTVWRVGLTPPGNGSLPDPRRAKLSVVRNSVSADSHERPNPNF